MNVMTSRYTNDLSFNSFVPRCLFYSHKYQSLTEKSFFPEVVKSKRGLGCELSSGLGKINP